MRIQHGCKWLLIVSLLAIGGCEEEAIFPEAPPTPNATEVQALLDNLDKIEGQFGLAMIAATPSQIGGNPFSIRDTEDRIQKLKRNIEFSDKCEPLADELVSGKASLRAFLKSPNERDWSDAWRHLVTMHSGLVDFMSSTLWHGQVPSKESAELARQLEFLGASMTRLTS